MFLKQLDLTTALRPAYLTDEVLLFVQDNVGLYEGKYKLPNQQNGQVYLTSHRICYVDKASPRMFSVALDLRDIERYELYNGFLKSSPKITLFPKPPSRMSTLQNRSLGRSSYNRPTHQSSPLTKPRSESAASLNTSATWVCTICSFSNPVPTNFDPTLANEHTPLPPCLACGIKPTLGHVLKAAIANATKHANTYSTPTATFTYSASTAKITTATAPTATVGDNTDIDATFQCPRCTFANHPSLMACEICGAPLLSQNIPQELDPMRTESPGPTLPSKATLDAHEPVKISFRGGGEKVFYERLKGSITQRKWLLNGAPPIPNKAQSNEGGPTSSSSSSNEQSRPTVKSVGIAALEQKGVDMRKNNEIMIGNAFEDLEALMASAKEIVDLAERFSRKVNRNSTEATSVATQLGLVTTKDIAGTSESLYLSELARTVAEFLTDDSRGVLKKAGGVISLVDLWAMFNRARGGVELVSPTDFEMAARLFHKLKLPVRLRTFKSGVLVVQGKDRTDDSIIRALLEWLDDLHQFPPDKEVSWDWHEFGRGVTAQDAAERFGWSIGVAEEELDMAEQKGVLCREESIEGLKYWKNYIGSLQAPASEAEQIEQALKLIGII
ncbi:Vacuolar protein-sorting-associated protein 36 [Ceratocystis pirilliformis]|uniref:Vacuolar protein-sorting-associated protein 36 n=1 Tax=Ceratocystis pirilliformis TaxID=259994 RepID=A0ABR3ZM80_9PEZI